MIILLSSLLLLGPVSGSPAESGQYRSGPPETGFTANEVIQRIKENVTCRWNSETVDTFKAGDPAMKVQKAAFVAGAPGSSAHIMMLEREDIDLIVIGEAGDPFHP